MDYGDSAVGVERNMRALVNEEVVAWTLADNPEIVHERLSKLSVLERSFKAGIFRHPCRLILIPRRFAYA